MTSTTGTFSALHAAADSLVSLQTHHVQSLYTCHMIHSLQVNRSSSVSFYVSEAFI